MRIGTTTEVVHCRIIRDYDQGVITMYRTDTNEKVDERTMTADERQMGLRMDT